MADIILQTQEIQLSDSFSLLVPDMGGTADDTVFLLLPGYHPSKQFSLIPILATVLFPCVFAVRHTVFAGVIFCTGTYMSITFMPAYNSNCKTPTSFKTEL